MKSPLRLPALLVAVSLCTGSCLITWAQSASPSDGPGAHSSAVGMSASPASDEAVIPGPLRSLLRMAGISQKISPDEVLPLLARNAFSQGYEGWQGSSGRTEFLVLLIRYVEQARELAALAGPEGVIRVSNCDDAAPLLKVLGYRLRQDCGQSSASLVTADPEKAFLTTDSGFPLPELEETLQGGKPFTYSFQANSELLPPGTTTRPDRMQI